MVSPWIIAIRPKTLTIAVVPVCVATALAWSEAGTMSWLVLVCAMTTSVLIQIGTNLHNDAADFEQGADDSATRLGPPRATAEGWLAPKQVRKAAALSFVLAIGAGGYLTWIGGWPILITGLLSIAAGIAYTGGPKPIAYIGLGELFVFVFFGLVAVCGTYYLQSGALSWSAWIAGALVGMPAAAVLAVNNYRDLENDRRAGKNTLAVRLGPRATRIEYALLMLLPFTLLPLIPAVRHSGSWIVLPLLIMPWALYLVIRFQNEPPGRPFNRILAATALFQLGLGLLLCLSLFGAQVGLLHG
jgi:1,4-dihydroxy-2-naphthoate octaprenyltransferase